MEQSWFVSQMSSLGQKGNHRKQFPTWANRNLGDIVLCSGGSVFSARAPLTPVAGGGVGGARGYPPLLDSENFFDLFCDRFGYLVGFESHGRLS